MPVLDVTKEIWPLAGTFTISRGSRTDIPVIVVTLSSHGKIGRGECVPTPRYGESVESVIAQIEGLRLALAAGFDRQTLQSLLPPGAARNGLDLAFWDLEAKLSGKRAWELAGMASPRPVTTCYTISLDTAEKMGAAAKRNRKRPVLKLKLAGPEDVDRVRAVRKNAPESFLVVDANEGWDIALYRKLVPELQKLEVSMIEQPLPAKDDEALRGVARPIPLCADESCHTRADLPALAGKYDLVNIKLDKTGGLTEALALKKDAKAAGFSVMVGCMLGTSLGVAPGVLASQGAQVVDLDGPLWLARDREPGLSIAGSVMQPPRPELWG